MIFRRRRVEPEIIAPPLIEPEPAPSVIQVSMADKAAEVVVVESLKTVFLRVASDNKTQAEAARIEVVYTEFREHLKQHGYHLEIFI